jgi:hypothetical protein
MTILPVTTRFIIFNTHITNNCNRNNKGVDSVKQTEKGGVTDTEDVAILIRLEHKAVIELEEDAASIIRLDHRYF